MMRAIAALLTVFTFFAGATQADEHVAGTVTRMQTPVLAVQDALPRILKVGDPIYIGDVISTGKDARIEVEMTDDGILTLGEKTSFTVNDYVRTGDEESNAVLRLLAGSFRAVNGGIAKAAPGKFKVETEVATIGIRGTEFWGGALDGVFNIALLGGTAVIVENKAGRVEITEVGAGTTITSAGVALM
jgi:hypothetical protein